MLPPALDQTRSSRPACISDFAWTKGRVRIRKTGIELKPDGKLAAEVLQWIPWLLILGVVALGARLRRRPPLAIWYAPDTPRPWYLMRAAALWAGFSVARSPELADAAFYFEDVTRGSAQPHPDLPAFNFACTDVSKSHVAGVFEAVFGYPLAVDPTAWDGPMVEKSEKNGVHDGRLVTRADGVREGCVYQRLVDTTDPDGKANDLRTLCVGGTPVIVWLKIKPAGARFAIHSQKAFLKDPADMFSGEELRLIGVFTRRMGLDCGGIDILRDRDGRIYIVDVNKTDLGPVIALSWSDKVRSMGRLSRAMQALVGSAIPVRDTAPGHQPAGVVRAA